jgi:hypothetical protein
VAHNIGDALTYWIFDDQMKYLVAQSVVRPYQQNCKVKWNPAFASVPFGNTARKEGDAMPDKAKCNKWLADCENVFDRMEPDSLGHPFTSITPGKHNLPSSLKPGSVSSRTIDDTPYEDPGISIEDNVLNPIPEQDEYTGKLKL